MNTLIILPARYASSRLPAKLLAKIGEKTVVQRAYEQCLQSQASRVLVATDHEEIYNHILAIGGEAVMTHSAHISGTSRCAEAYEIYQSTQKERFDLVINVQADEPFIQPAQINSLIRMFANAPAAVKIGTLVKPIQIPAQISNPNTVKALLRNDFVNPNQAQPVLYFSRAPIPYYRDLGTKSKQYAQKWLHATQKYYKHIGIYAFRPNVLLQICQPAPASAHHTLEHTEKLEQLGWIQAGFTIFAKQTHTETIGIDTLEDLQKAINSYQRTVNS
jgi:3-deoxy-manno-octulosonate cytidylyltransferase (CMP-KDO synthetase)